MISNIPRILSAIRQRPISMHIQGSMHIQTLPLISEGIMYKMRRLVHNHAKRSTDNSGGYRVSFHGMCQTNNTPKQNRIISWKCAKMTTTMIILEIRPLRNISALHKSPWEHDYCCQSDHCNHMHLLHNENNSSQGPRRELMLLAEGTRHVHDHCKYTWVAVYSDKYTGIQKTSKHEAFQSTQTAWSVVSKHKPKHWSLKLQTSIKRTS